MPDAERVVSVGTGNMRSFHIPRRALMLARGRMGVLDWSDLEAWILCTLLKGRAYVLGSSSLLTCCRSLMRICGVTLHCLMYMQRTHSYST